MSLTDTIQSPSIHKSADAAPPPRTRKQVILGMLQFFCLCYGFFIMGWNDGTTGPLLPRIQKVYHANFVIVSLLFVIYCIGVITGSLTNLFVADKLGIGKVLAIASSCQNVAYLLQAFALTFPIYIVCFALAGFGVSFQIAHGCGFVAALKNPTKMGFLHAAYGLGALVSPLISTQFAQLKHWSYHYFISFALSLLNTTLLILIFKLQQQNACLIEAGFDVPDTEKPTNDAGTLDSVKEIMKTKAVHLMAAFVFIYVGVEITIGGWIVTYVLLFRNGGTLSGYVSTGFYGGIALGRVGLLWVNKKVGERRVLLIYAVLAIGLEFVVWFAPSLIADAVAVSLAGFFLGPMYSIAINECGRILPPWILTNSIGWINAFGFTGSALLPFMTGAISQRWGIMSLQPLMIIMMVTMSIFWLLMPKKILGA
ncbi:hypothetical protein AMATHDRAFT_81964 [Amanita thiersii Skay4041]|uniref:Major facilitator superfamily (MFS) profile domain-containing protein n=1 Tax=Amanita thiersii Skay4041 TaxID=703135 RepID=A0A2A9NK29_9AGAR|nr:hypothetical protein AMATHDRAFT_81964 [Amanita thiersii Skay4041]